MLLGNYFHNINKNYKNFSFSGISFDTKSIKKNNIFFAIKGNSIDGNKFIPKAIKKGSKIIVTEKKVNQFQNGILYIHTNNVRKLLAETAFKIYNKKPKNLIAVTGTNGKSTFATILYEILSKSGLKVSLGGNIGIPALSLSINECDIIIFEISSFQLELIDDFKADISILLNITEDHAERYESFEEYQKTKIKIFLNLYLLPASILYVKTKPSPSEYSTLLDVMLAS